MTREYDQLYARHQMLAALVRVLVHDLRNPLHSATLLIEAMGSPSANVDALRDKLRAQIGKLDGLIAETHNSMRDLAVEPTIEVVAVDALLRAIVEAYPELTQQQASFVLPASSDVKVSTDRKLLERAAVEIAAAIADAQGTDDAASVERVIVTLDEPEEGGVRVRFGDLSPDRSAAIAKAPFGIAAGGIRLAMARSLTQSAGAMLRFEQDAEGVGRFGFFLRKTV